MRRLILRLALALALLPALLVAGCNDAPKGHQAQHKGKAEQRGWSGGIRDGSVMTPGEELPDPVVLTYQVVAPRDAVAMNAAMPISTEPLIAAKPFKLDAALTPDQKAAASDCLTAAIYYEATSEGETGERAVAQVVLNRLRHPAFAKTVCGVVFQGSERVTGCQFTFTCDGALARLPNAAGWARARKYADQALAGRVEKSVGLSTHYHTQYVVPYWRSDLSKLAVIGAHIFYRWQGGFGLSRSAVPQTSEILPIKLAAALPSFVHIPGGVFAEGALPAPVADGGASQLIPALAESRAIKAPASRLLADRGQPAPVPAASRDSKVKLPPPRDPLLKADDDAVKPAADASKGELIGR